MIFTPFQCNNFFRSPERCATVNAVYTNLLDNSGLTLTCWLTALSLGLAERQIVFLAHLGDKVLGLFWNTAVIPNNRSILSPG
jgi:hypothetical protein